MRFRITGLDPAPFVHLYGLPDDALLAHGAVRRVVDAPTGFPDRIELIDGAPGDSMLLVNYLHQPHDTPFRASHAIYVREGAMRAAEHVDEVPALLKSRVLSLRAFDARHMMVDADLATGDAIAPRIVAFFADPSVAYLHAHYAKPGCYAARIDRIDARKD